MKNEVEFERDLVLAPNTFAYILDKTQGEVVCHVGPSKLSLADSDQPVAFNPQSKRFDEVPLARSIQPLVIAPEGWYLILKNPALTDEGKLRLPKRGKNQSQEAELTVGRKVNIPGPVSLPLWPGQMAQVVQGHHLRSNQYLRARVYDEEAALKNRDDAIIKASDTQEEQTAPRSLIPENLTIGQQFNIMGTDVSFFIPPTGIEIVRTDGDEDNEFIRDAETLEVLEYCILLDEDGNKSFVRGPAVVFPEPTQTFVTKWVYKKGEAPEEVRKFLAFELNNNMGLYLKVIKDYTDNDGEHTAGEELFITGQTHPVYFPREEHAIIKYGDNKKINYAVAIPSGEGRYLLNRDSGDIKTVTGPVMMLPDPRHEVVVRRVLKEKDIKLMYPGNTQALEINRQLDALRDGSNDYVAISNMIGAADAFAVDTESARSVFGQKHASGPKTRSAKRKSLQDFAGDELQRGDSYTPPRTITLDNKYDGVVTVNVWTGYAVNVVKKTGERRVVVGPKTILLNYDENLEPFSLSKGCPKDKRNKKEDVYLRVLNNRVTDKISLQTRDLVDLSVILSYRVNFTGDESRWFDVDDYVGLLTDHMRSVLRNAVQRLTIEEFWGGKIDIIRDCVLGASENGQRLGRKFEQNGMEIYDVDFIDATIQDAGIAKLLVDAQHNTVRMNLDLESQRREFGLFQELEDIKRKRATVQEETEITLNEARLASIERKSSVQVREINAQSTAEELRLSNQKSQQDALSEIQEAELERDRKNRQLRDDFARAALQMRVDELMAVKQAEIERIQAITPDLVAAMQSLTHGEMVEKVCKYMSPFTVFGGESAVEVARRLFKGTGLEDVVESLPEHLRSLAKSNGSATHTAS